MTASGEIKMAGVGRIAVITNETGLVRVEFLADESPRVARCGNGKAARVRDRALDELAGYADGGKLTCPVDLDAVTPFRRRVLEALRGVGRGKTVSYGELARMVGSPGAARAVGSACANNPVPLWIPCHRVLAGDGRIGGFSGGLAVKRALLAIEGTQVA